MNKAEYKVYWTTLDSVTQGHVASDLSDALSIAATLRSIHMRFVAVIAEDPNCVSLSGASGMEET